jgi:hypothetical protein
VDTIDLHTDAPPAAQNAAVVGYRSFAAANNKRPPLFVPADELLFWTREWQSGEAESKAQRDAGNLRTFDNGADLLDWLRSDDD